jgi:predicted nucleotidyltransferase
MELSDDKRIQERRRYHEPKLPVCSSEPPTFSPEQQQLFREVLAFMNDKGIPYVVSGTFALHEHTGIWRQTKDLDLFVTPRDMRRALELFREAGYDTWVKDPVWLGKVMRSNYYVDLITGMSNAVIQVDQKWIERGVPSEVLGVPAKVLGAEELMASKIFVVRRERFDGADVVHIIYAMRDMLDWERLFKLVGEHWEMLLWSLIFYRYIYPRHANEIPRWVWHDLLAKFERDLVDPKLDAPFRGSLIDENMFAIDVQEWGMENEIEKYRAAHHKRLKRIERKEGVVMADERHQPAAQPPEKEPAA